MQAGSVDSVRRSFSVQTLENRTNGSAYILKTSAYLRHQILTFWYLRRARYRNICRMDRKEIRAVIVAALQRSGLNPYRAAIGAGMPADAIRHLIAGHEPKASRLAQICAALGLEFYVGPPRAGAIVPDVALLPSASLRDLEAGMQVLSRVVADAGRDPVPDDLWPVLAARRGVESPAPGNENLPVGSPPVDVIELAAVAGGGTGLASEEVTGCSWFRRDWLEQHGLHPKHCAVIAVRDESMEPTLPSGCSILVDRSHTGWQRESIYVVRTEDGLIVKRAGFTEDGSRLLLSDHPAWAPASWPEDAAIVGKVCWVARTLL